MSGLEIEQHTAEIHGVKHSPELQSICGAAAAIVLVHHSLYIDSAASSFRLWSEVALNAHAAVIAFFVLSGFVSTRLLQGGEVTRASLIAFLSRRAFRIYPAPWGASVLATIAAEVAGAMPPILKLGAAFLGIGPSLPLPIWTLFVELLSSLLIPVIVRSIQTSLAAFALILGGLLAVSLTFGDRIWMHAGTYLVDFVLGSTVAFKLPMRAASIRRQLTVLIFCAGLVLLYFGRWLGPWTFATDYHNRYAALIEAVGSVGLIDAVAGRPSAFPLLRSRALVWLGDISYSLYLVHLPVLLLCFTAAVSYEVGPVSAGAPLGMLACARLFLRSRSRCQQYPTA